MKQLLRDNRYFFIPYISLVLISLFFILIYSKPELHILFNHWHSSGCDSIFKLITNLGDGLMYLLALLILLFVKYRWAVILAFGSFLSNVIIQLSKWVLFPDTYRPSKYFELYETYQLHLIEGVKLHALHSFPSGHTTTAFNIMVMLVLLSKNNSMKFILLVLAALIGYSRVYLSQHFLIDTVVGSIIGTTCILISWQLISKSKKAWLDKSLLSSRK